MFPKIEERRVKNHAKTTVYDGSDYSQAARGQVVTIRSCKVLPLPNVASGRTPQCRARSKRSLERCKNPAAYRTPVCRFHGARRPDAVLRGPSHPQYRHGRETLDAKRGRVEAMTRIRVLTDLDVLGGFLKRRIPDRLVCHRELLLLQR